jgi:hypothetical protein
MWKSVFGCTPDVVVVGSAFSSVAMRSFKAAFSILVEVFSAMA